MKTQTLEQTINQLPEVQAGRGVIQNEFHEFDVYNHTIKVVEALREMTQNTETIIAAYLHDIGKPVVAEPRLYDGVPQYDEQGRARHTFPNHEYIGAQMVREMNSEIFTSLELNQDNIAKLVEHHFTPMKGIKQMRKATTYQEFLTAYETMKNTLEESGTNLTEIMSLFTADVIGKGSGAEDAEELISIRNAILGQNTLPEVYQSQKQLGGTDRRYSVKE